MEAKQVVSSRKGRTEEWNAKKRREIQEKGVTRIWKKEEIKKTPNGRETVES